MRVLLLVILLVPQLAAARVFMCVDQATGKTSFSDKGCQTTAAEAEVRLQAVNVSSGSRTAEAPATRTWISDRDTRKTGRDYAAERATAVESKISAEGLADR